MTKHFWTKISKAGLSEIKRISIFLDLEFDLPSRYFPMRKFGYQVLPIMFSSKVCTPKSKVQTHLLIYKVSDSFWRKDREMLQGAYMDELDSTWTALRWTSSSIKKFQNAVFFKILKIPSNESLEMV